MNTDLKSKQFFFCSCGCLTIRHTGTGNPLSHWYYVDNGISSTICVCVLSSDNIEKWMSNIVFLFCNADRQKMHITKSLFDSRHAHTSQRQNISSNTCVVRSNDCMHFVHSRTAYSTLLSLFLPLPPFRSDSWLRCAFIFDLHANVFWFFEARNSDDKHINRFSRTEVYLRQDVLPMNMYYTKIWKQIASDMSRKQIEFDGRFLLCICLCHYLLFLPSQQTAFQCM